jgi:hypothetical protein
MQRDLRKACGGFCQQSSPFIQCRRCNIYNEPIIDAKDGEPETLVDHRAK